MSEELKTCPFCGSLASVETNFGREYWVQCVDLANCGSTNGIEHQFPADAIAAWNRRAPERKLTDETISQAQQWAQEARTQRSTVLGILRIFGLPENDWEAERLILEHVAAQPASNSVVRKFRTTDEKESDEIIDDFVLRTLEAKLGCSPHSAESGEQTGLSATCEKQAQPADEKIAEFAAKLAAKQQPLPADFAKVLHDNLWELYARDEKAAQPAAATVPDIGSAWIHKNGTEYTVIAVANIHAEKRVEYPTTVVYKNESGQVWSRHLSRWHSSMKAKTPAAQPQDGGGHEQGN